MKDHKFSLIAAKDLRQGMRCDLQNDKYADPKGKNTSLEFELESVVEDSVAETAECTLVTFNFDCVGMPHDHLIKVLDETEYKVTTLGGEVLYQGDNRSAAYGIFDSRSSTSLHTRTDDFPFQEVALRP